MIYLASPYTGTAEAMQRRYETVLHVTATFIANRVWVYSPIVHCHEMAVRYKLPHDFAFWINYDENVIRRAEGVYVLRTLGWIESRGVQAEIRLAKALSKPLHYVTLDSEHITLYRADGPVCGELVDEFALI